MKRAIISLVAVFFLTGCGWFGSTTTTTSRVYISGPEAPTDSTRRALFIVQHSHIRDAEWMANEAPLFDVFVCNPAFTADEVQSLRHASDGGYIFAYSNALNAQVHQFQHPYFLEMEKYFPDSILIADVNGRLLDTYRNDKGVGLLGFVMRKETADSLISFHKNVTMLVNWDGIYFDQSFGTYPPWLERLLDEQAPDMLDYDQDGEIDKFEEANAVFQEYMPYFFLNLRYALGEDILVIANSAGAIHPYVNGICLEGVGRRFGFAQSLEIFQRQRKISEPPYVCIAYKHPDYPDTARKVALGLREVFVGDIR